MILDVSLTPPLRRLLRFGGRLSPGPGLGGNLGRLVFYLLQVNVSLASLFRSLDLIIGVLYYWEAGKNVPLYSKFCPNDEGGFKWRCKRKRERVVFSTNHNKDFEIYNLF